MKLFQATYVLLTYAQSEGLDPEAVGFRLSDLNAECIIAKENHKDGGTHLHVFAMFQPRLRTRNTRWADVDGFHPNCEAITRTPWKAFDYVIKDGDVVWGGLGRPEEKGVSAEGTDKHSQKAAAWRSLGEASTREEAEAILEEHFQRELWVNSSNIERRLNKLFPVKLRNEEWTRPITKRMDTREYPELSYWVDRYLKRDNMPGGKFFSGLSCPSLR